MKYLVILIALVLAVLLYTEPVGTLKDSSPDLNGAGVEAVKDNWTNKIGEF